MAAILIVEEDRVLAHQMARTLRQAGHFPMVALDAHSALRGAKERPAVIALNLERSELPGEELLARLRRQAAAARIPLVALTWKREAAVHLRENPDVADVLLKPVSGVRLREAVEGVLTTQGQPPVGGPRLERKRQRDLILLLLARAPDPLVSQIARRIRADRRRNRSPNQTEALSWADIADWGHREGLLDAEQASLLSRVSVPTPPSASQGAG